MQSEKTFKHTIFWPVFSSLLLCLVLSFLFPVSFKTLIGSINHWILNFFTPLYSAVALASLFTCLWVMISPLGKMRIGGADAKPIIGLYQWFSISLCTTTGAGILFWAMAEPVYHLHLPPESVGILAQSNEAAFFSMKSLFHHWGFVPSSLYTLFAILFAFIFYQMKLPFSLSSCLRPLLTPRPHGKAAHFVDGICLFALVAGMAASMGSGILILSGGFEHLTEYPSGPLLWIGFGVLIIVTFLASALSGLHRGIQMLSDWNVRFFMGLVLFVLFVGPAGYFIPLGFKAFFGYLSEIVPHTLLLPFSFNDPWPKMWTVFYWSNWLAWTPITALFLARIGFGYTYRQFVLMNLVVPAIFCCGWMTLFGGTALQMDSHGVAKLFEILQSKGPEGVTFEVLNNLPLDALTIPALLVTAFLAYVTAADSNTVVMAGLCAHGIEPESTEPPKKIKLIWGIVVGAVSIAALCASGLDGIRELSTLGGFPILLLQTVVILNVVLVSIAPQNYADTTTGTITEPEKSIPATA